MKNKKILTLLIASSLFVAGCDSSNTASAPTQKAIPVTAITITPASQAVKMELPGRVVAFKKAEVRPQVTGIISQRNFEEGGFVEKGQSLYQIDDATYQANLLSAKASLARAQAAEESTGATAKRYQALLKRGSISKQDLDEAVAAYKQAKADVAVAKAEINTVQVNLNYTQVKAPISGIIGKSDVTSGALVTASQTQPLTTISQLDPINIDIVQSSAQLLKLKSSLKQGQLQKSESAKVSLILEDGTTYEHEGELKFAEVNVNETTGSFTLRAEFPNPDGLLLPGMYARATVTTGVDSNAILVPQNAIARDTKGNAIAMLVDNDNKVVSQVIETAEVIDNQWRVVKGLKAGDKLITTGLQMIKPGATVTIKSENNDKAEEKSQPVKQG